MGLLVTLKLFILTCTADGAIRVKTVQTMGLFMMLKLFVLSCTADGAIRVKLYRRWGYS